MSDYTPSVGVVRARYCDSIVRKDGVPHSFVVTPEEHAKNHAEFDRMIAEVERNAAADAWDEGWKARADRSHLKRDECVPAPAHINPYRAGETREGQPVE